ncbi:Flp pilus assembly protein CpaB [Kribbella sp. NBC_01245]|uniref:Flp pilus assembly protein CpaB n=1 Tax=Kribbella sp. NBC_01245 TaxID=2903578 RepID=UPI002E2CCF3D|nr:Flp pilus assembly protein CpaB [Kribbella sp. NBC_01245]
MKRRVVTIILAVALAVLGTAAVLVYVNHADARAVAGQQAVTVLVADKAIPSGTTAKDAKSSLRREILPASSVSTEAITEITAKQEELVISADLSPGQLLLHSMLVAAKDAGGLVIPDGKVAVTFTLCAPEIVAGNVRVGSDVAVFGTVVVNGNGDVSAQPNCTGQHKQQIGKGLGTTRVVVPKVRVIAIGPASSSTPPEEDAKATGNTFSQSGAGPQNDRTLVTVAVNQDDAERLILLTQTGLPYLALIGPSAQITPDDHVVPQFPPPAKKK